MSTSLVGKLSTETVSGRQLFVLLGNPDYLATQAEWRYKLRAHPNVIFPGDYWLSVLVWDEEHAVTKAWIHPG